jgi:alkylhydroperoxidase family enzyme
VQAIYDDWQRAPIDERLRSTLGMLEALMRRPESLGVAPFERMREAGHDRISMEDAVAVGAQFACITRVADSLGFPALNLQSKKMTAVYLLGNGYALEPAQRLGPRRYAEGWANLGHAVENTPGHAEPELRRRVFAWIEADARGSEPSLDTLPFDLHPLIRKASRNAYKVTDEDIATLLGKGWHEGAVFEIVVTIAASAGSSRYAIAMDAIDALA